MQATIGLVVVTAALVLVTTFLAIFTYRLWSTTKTMVEKSEKVSGSQLTEMQKSIAEQARAASAMEEVGKHISISAKAATESVTLSRERSAQQMRAYLSVNIGVAIYQERDKGLKFEAKPLILNTGHTPAHKVSYRAKAGILSVPLPDDFSFPLDEKVIGAAVLGPQQHFITSAVRLALSARLTYMAPAPVVKGRGRSKTLRAAAPRAAGMAWAVRVRARAVAKGACLAKAASRPPMTSRTLLATETTITALPSLGGDATRHRAVGFPSQALGWAPLRGKEGCRRAQGAGRGGIRRGGGGAGGRFRRQAGPGARRRGARPGAGRSGR